MAWLICESAGKPAKRYGSLLEWKTCSTGPIYDHLGGINRVTLSSVAIGGQLPGMGRSLYVGMEYAL
jgi:hypothetical protein